MKNSQLDQLVNEGILSPEKALEIKTFFGSKSSSNTNTLNVVFSVLGAILFGLGIILIVAHNWDDFSRGTKAIFAFIPLLVGQGLCAWHLFGKGKSTGFKEAASAFLIISIGACIALISQIYQIPGKMSDFLLLWILLSLPLVFIMRSGVAALLSVILVTWYSLDYSAIDRNTVRIWYILFMVVLGFYTYRLYLKKPESNFLSILSWFLPISLLFGLNLMHNERYFYEEDFALTFFMYLSLCGVFYLIGNHKHFQENALWKRSFTILGSLGTAFLLYFFTFYEFWEEAFGGSFHFTGVITIVLILIGALLLFLQKKSNSESLTRPANWIFLAFAVIYILAYSGIPILILTVLCNLLVLALGLLTIKAGAEQNHFGILNYGLLIILLLVVCRFFDEGLSFVIRGSLFIGTGILFFVANYKLIQKRKQNEQ